MASSGTAPPPAAAPPPRPLSAARAARQEALEAYAILDSPPDGVYDDLAQLAADACSAPLCGITFLDYRGARQFWKSSYGLPAGASSNVPLPDEAAERMNVCAQARCAARAPRNPTSAGKPRTGSPLRLHSSRAQC
jgi:hypothetical protein